MTPLLQSWIKVISSYCAQMRGQNWTSLTQTRGQMHTIPRCGGSGTQYCAQMRGHNKIIPRCGGRIDNL